MKWGRHYITVMKEQKSSSESSLLSLELVAQLYNTTYSGHSCVLSRLYMMYFLVDALLHGFLVDDLLSIFSVYRKELYRVVETFSTFSAEYLGEQCKGAAGSEDDLDQVAN